MTSSSTSFSVQPNQSAVDDYKNSDLMWASVYNQAKTTNDVNLQFAHKMSKIVISVTGTEGVTIKSIRLINTVREIALSNISASTRALGALAAATSANNSIVLATSDNNDGEEELSGAALFPPQTISGDFIEVVTNYGTTLFSTTDKTFVGSTEYTANLVITRQIIGMTAAITDWTADNGTIAVPPGSSAGLYINNIPNQTYTGSAITPTLSITYSMNSVDYDLVEGIDYDLQFFNNVNQGSATIIINGKADPAKIGSGNEGTHEAASAIAKIRAIKNFNIVAATGNISYPNSNAKKTVEYLYNATVDNPLDKGNGDGTFTYESTDPTVAKVSESGTVTILAAGTTTIKAHMAADGNYTESHAQYELEVTPRSLKNNHITNNTGEVTITLPTSSFTYTGSPFQPSVVIRDNGRLLLEGTHFTCTYTSNINAGTGTVTIRGYGNYSYEDADKVTKTFTISKASPNLQMANSAVKLAKGHNYTRRATADFGANTIQWSISESGYATVEDGTVTATNTAANSQPKTVTITASIAATDNWNADSKSYQVTIVESSWTYNYTGGVQSWTCPLSGYYELEAYGAKGANAAEFYGGRGARIAGMLYLTEGQNLYIYVGQKGRETTDRTKDYTFNGGGYYNGSTADGATTKFASGGGATDFALKSATWSSNDHLYSRILVAGGGGGGLYYRVSNSDLTTGAGGAGGGESTYNRAEYAGETGIGGSHPGNGGTLTAGGTVATGGGTNAQAGSFGKGGIYSGTLSGGCGGGGWYGGASGSQVDRLGAGGGGSSFIYNAQNLQTAKNGGFTYTLSAPALSSSNYLNASNLEITPTSLVAGGGLDGDGRAVITYKSAE